jgi:hypothetical protein
VLFRKRSRLRPLSERECYLRLHGARGGEIEVLAHRSRPPAAPPPSPGPAWLDGPTDLSPALHLVFTYPRGAGTLTGEEIRLELLRRMQSRDGQAA